MGWFPRRLGRRFLPSLAELLAEAAKLGRLPAKAESALWGDFAFVPAGSPLGFRGHAVLRLALNPDGSCDIIEVWPLAVVLANLAATAAEFLLADASKQPTYSDLAQWADQTAALAGRLPYGGGLRDEMLAIAGRARALQEWPGKFSQPPPRGRAEELEYRLNLTFWAMNELRKAARFPSSDFWTGGVGVLFGGEIPDRIAKVLDPDVIEKRSQRFAKKLKPGAAPALMRDVLHDHTQYGCLLPDGSKNPNGPADRAENPRPTPNIH